VPKTIEARHDGGSRFVATSGSGHVVVLDNAEGDTGMRPTEVILAGLAACTAMDVVSIMNKKRQPFDSYVVRASGVQREELPDVYVRIDLVHEVVGAETDEAQVRRCIELSATKYCPVSAMLSAGYPEIHHRYAIRRSADGPVDLAGEVLVTGPFQRSDVLPA
jgi:putative redox protein